jgi:hypothetical protein
MKTEEVVTLLSDPKWGIETDSPGGDYDTTNLILTPRNSEESLFICGFSPNRNNPDKDDWANKLVEVGDGQDSRGGLNSSDASLAHAYAEVCTRLRKAGFEVVPKMDVYF